MCIVEYSTEYYWTITYGDDIYMYTVRGVRATWRKLKTRIALSFLRIYLNQLNLKTELYLNEIVYHYSSRINSALFGKHKKIADMIRLPLSLYVFRINSNVSDNVGLKQNKTEVIWSIVFLDYNLSINQ